MELILTENRQGGAVSRLRCSHRMHEKLKCLQYAGGFLRFSIDVYCDGGGNTNMPKLNKFLREIQIFK